MESSGHPIVETSEPSDMAGQDSIQMIVQDSNRILQAALSSHSAHGSQSGAATSCEEK